jgi:phospholipid/cholesterol/gamma-HCH transport system substrate-binding protein
MTAAHRTTIKLLIFGIVMALLTTGLFFVFGQYQTGSKYGYSAVFADASRLKGGDTVRVAGIRVGTVNAVALRPDKTALVTFDADRDIVLTAGTKAAVRYLNLVGDRYLELIDGPGSTRVLPAGSQIPMDRTAPALDLDLLLGGLKPVIQGLDPQDVNGLTSALLQIFQGEGGTLDSLLSKTSSFSNTLADNSQVVEELIDNLNTLMGTVAKDGNKFSNAVDRLQRLVTELSADRDPIGGAVDSRNHATASLANLLTDARPPLSATVDQLTRVAPLLDQDKGTLDAQLQKTPDNLRKLIRLGSYGSWVNYYVCGLNFRVTDLQGRTAVFPWIKQEGGRCSEP